jgi:REP element-mobilizing transposase RayT
MVRYRRNRLEGGKFFFTLTLADRRSTVLVDQISALRAAFRATRQQQPCGLNAVVILPDHLHAILTLPDGDADFPGRWRRIKGISAPTCWLQVSKSDAIPTANLPCGNRATGNTLFVMTTTSPDTWTTFISIP